MSEDRFYYFSRSADKSPGSGANEYVSNPNKYVELSQTPNWRKMLSNFWVAPFNVNGIYWNTVEHMFQAYKINLVNPQLAGQFAMNSNSALSRSSGDEAQKNRKIAILTPQQLQQWNQLKHEVMYSALYAKFSQNSNLKKVLLDTKDAQLWHGTRGVPAARQWEMEKVRAQLQLEDQKIKEIPFNVLIENMNQVSSYNIDPSIQILTSLPHVLMTFRMKDGNVYVVKLRYDIKTNQILPPI